jgi:glycerol-3-phosphate dehydrogenase
VGVRWRDALTGESGEARTGVVVNVTGGWSPRWGRGNGFDVPMRPGKGVHLSLDRRQSNYGIICKAVDGRQMFVMPHEEESIIGTTDDDFYGDPDDLEVTDDEVEYLLEGAASLVPSVREARVTRAWSGVRTTLYAWGPTEDELSRDHRILDHAAEGAAGLLSFVGGKLASYRAQSEEIADRVAARVGRATRPCRTAEEPLPGGDDVPSPRALAGLHGIAEGAAARIVYRHGSLAREVLRLADEDPRLKLCVCRDEGILAAEVVWIARHEKVRRLEDLRRRCRLGVAGCGGLDCARLAAQLVARELSWDPDRLRAELANLLEVGWRERRPILDGWQLAEEELLRAAHRGLGGL